MTSIQPKNCTFDITPGEPINAPGPVLLMSQDDGDITVETLGGDVVTFVGVTKNFTLPVQVSKVLTSGTTVTNMIALW